VGDLYSLVMECSVFDPRLVLSGFIQCHGVGAYEALRSELTDKFCGPEKRSSCSD